MGFVPEQEQWHICLIWRCLWNKTLSKEALQCNTHLSVLNTPSIVWLNCIICSLYVRHYYERNISLFLGFLIGGQEVSHRYCYYTYVKAQVLTAWVVAFVLTTLKLQVINPCGFQSELHTCAPGDVTLVCPVPVSPMQIYVSINITLQLQATTQITYRHFIDCLR